MKKSNYKNELLFIIYIKFIQHKKIMEGNLKTCVIEKFVKELNESEITDPEYKKFIIDVAKPSEIVPDLNFKDYNSELCLEHLKTVGHTHAN